jgi:hypothetical protein
MQDSPDEPVKLSSRLRTGAMTSINCLSRTPGSNGAKRRAANRTIMQGKNECPGR